MKYCTKCGAQCDNSAYVCPTCGNSFAQPNPYPAAVDINDHTAEYDPRDISDNKVIAMLPYLLGVFGLIIALLMASNSKFVAFHVRTALKFTVVTTLLTMISVLLCWTVIVPLAAGVCNIIIAVLQIIAFIQVCQGKAKDPAIISSLGFLK